MRASLFWPALPAAVLIVQAFIAASAQASITLNFSDPSGLAAVAEFTLQNPTTVIISLRNTSTGVPGGTTAAGQLLTGISWDAGAPGVVFGDPEITGGTIVTGPNSFSINFSEQNVGANANVGGEWGFGNLDGSGLMNNFISGNASQNVPFGGPNLDGPNGLDGPQAGLVSAAQPVPLGGLGAIQDEVIATITLSAPIGDLLQLLANGARVEFGSSSHFLEQQVPGPGAAVILLGAFGCRRRRRN